MARWLSNAEREILVRPKFGPEVPKPEGGVSCSVPTPHDDCTCCRHWRRFELPSCLEAAEQARRDAEAGWCREVPLLRAPRRVRGKTSWARVTARTLPL